MSEISNMDDTIDSRDVIKRIDELQGELQDLEDTLEQVTADSLDVDPDNAAAAASAATEVTDAHDALADWNEDNAEELKHLLALQAEAEDYGDWAHGATLIRESHFEDYCRELCEDIGAIPSPLPDYLVIDWAATADNLKVDYVEIEFDGQDYYICS